MLDGHGFDFRAISYDRSILEADRKYKYPFAVNAVLMNAICGAVRQNAPAKVLDVGLGTVLLAKK